MSDPVTVGLADAIEALRGELSEAIRRGSQQGMQFQLDPIELTIQVAVTKEANGKIGWTVLGLGGSYEAASTQTLKLRLTAVWKSADGTLVKDFTIAGDLERGEQRPRTPPGEAAPGG
jgi:hypothetical protein